MNKNLIEGISNKLFETRKEEDGNFNLSLSWEEKVYLQNLIDKEFHSEDKKE